MKFRSRFFLWAILAVFLIFFRSRWAMRSGGYDEECYIQWLHWFLGLAYPPCYSPSHSPGIALVWWPIGALALVLSKLTSLPFIELVKPLISLSSFAFWGASVFLIDAILQKLKTNKEPPVPLWLPLAILANVRLLEHAARQNFWNHPAEFALALTVVLACLHGRYPTAVLLSALVCFIRINDAPIFLVVAGAFADRVARRGAPLSGNTKKITGALAILIGITLGYVVYQIGFVSGYNGMSIPIVVKSFSIARYAQAFVMGFDGLLWVAGWFLLCIGMGLYHCRKLSWLAISALIWMGAELMLVVGLNGIRADYGAPAWRYFIGSFAGAVVLWNEVYRLSSPRFQKISTAVLLIYAIWLPLQMYAYDGVVIHKALNVELSLFPENHILQRFELLLHPTAVFKLLGQAPVGFTLFSWFCDHPALIHYAQFAKYALKGLELWVMTIATVAVVIAETVLTYSLLRDWRRKRK